MIDKDRRVPFLLYHAIEPDVGSTESWKAGERVYVLTVSSFEEQLIVLKKHKFNTILVRDFLGWRNRKKGLPENPVLLTFDDGHLSNYEVVLPLLLKYGYNAEFFITTCNVGESRYLKKEQIRELHSHDMGIGSHAVRHRYLTDLHERDVKAELNGSKYFLEDCLGEEIICFSPPGGRITHRIEDMADESGYKAICNSNLRRNSMIDSPFDLGRITIKNGTEIVDFYKYIVDGPLMSDVFLNYFAKSAKMILGNNMYDRIREFVWEKNS